MNSFYTDHNELIVGTVLVVWVIVVLAVAWYMKKERKSLL